MLMRQPFNDDQPGARFQEAGESGRMTEIGRKLPHCRLNCPGFVGGSNS
ncbi:hypothetical protein QO014_002733 [Kaistia dalseonensis]|uniref:Uncharacterized protein n=1 Tax=Kaistia dalseonensis TaxID=410840 RepID=A0ABU0HA48_9HYPH|nr:hypothetical protein [Kaistia dalseonensis]